MLKERISTCTQCIDIMGNMPLLCDEKAGQKLGDEMEIWSKKILLRFIWVFGNIIPLFFSFRTMSLLFLQRKKADAVFA